MQKQDVKKMQKVSEYLQKGVEWCANQLWNARRENNTLREDMEKLRRECFRNEITLRMSEAYKESNYLMHDVLVYHHIFPTKLTLHFRENDCEGCYEETTEECFYCEPPQKEIVETAYLYTVRIENGYLEGITSEFKRKGVDCFKIVNTDTGEILYEEKEGKE